MQKPLQITLHGMEHTAALDDQIRHRALKLEEFYPRMIGCHVTIDKPHQHRHQGEQFDVRIDIHLPGKAEVVINRQHAEDVYVALRDAFDAAKRKLEEHVRMQRGDIKVHPTPLHGRVLALYAEEGYGFIQTEDGRELYFGRDNVVHPNFDKLVVGDHVQFIEEMAQEGPQAKRVTAGRHSFT